MGKGKMLFTNLHVKLYASLTFFSFYTQTNPFPLLLAHANRGVYGIFFISGRINFKRVQKCFLQRQNRQPALYFLPVGHNRLESRKGENQIYLKQRLILASAPYTPHECAYAPCPRHPPSWFDSLVAYAPYASRLDPALQANYCLCIISLLSCLYHIKPILVKN